MEHDSWEGKIRVRRGDRSIEESNRICSRGWLGSGQVAGTFSKASSSCTALCGTVKINSWLIDRSRRRRSNVKKGLAPWVDERGSSNRSRVELVRPR